MTKQERQRRNEIIKDAVRIKKLVKPIEKAFACHGMMLYGWDPGFLFHWEKSTISLPTDFVESLAVILRDKVTLEKEVKRLTKYAESATNQMMMFR